MKERTNAVAGSATGKNETPIYVHCVRRAHTTMMRGGRIHQSFLSELYFSSDNAFEKYMELILKEMRDNEIDEVIGRESRKTEALKWGFHIDGSWDILIKRSDGRWATTEISIEKKEVK